MRATPHTTYVSFGAHGDRLIATYNGEVHRSCVCMAASYPVKKRSQCYARLQ